MNSSRSDRGVGDVLLPVRTSSLGSSGRSSKVAMPSTTTSSSKDTRPPLDATNSSRESEAVALQSAKTLVRRTSLTASGGTHRVVHHAAANKVQAHQLCACTTDTNANA